MGISPGLVWAGRYWSLNSSGAATHTDCRNRMAPEPRSFPAGRVNASASIYRASESTDGGTLIILWGIMGYCFSDCYLAYLSAVVREDDHRWHPSTTRFVGVACWLPKRALCH